MIRIVFSYVVPLVLPVAGYMLYRLWDERRTRRAGGPVREPWENWPWAWIGTASVLCLAATLVSLALWVNIAPRDGVYIPAHEEDGHIVPGRIVPAPDAR